MVTCCIAGAVPVPFDSSTKLDAGAWLLAAAHLETILIDVCVGLDGSHAVTGMETNRFNGLCIAPTGQQQSASAWSLRARTAQYTQAIAYQKGRGPVKRVWASMLVPVKSTRRITPPVSC